jgi:RNA polymerase sigma factor (sigma-70 family)
MSVQAAAVTGVGWVDATPSWEPVTGSTSWPAERTDVMRSHSDARLAARIAAGDDLALGVLYDQYSPLIFGLARKVTGSLSGAEDVTQDSFASLWEQIGRFDVARGSLRAFLFTIAYRRAVDWVRREVSATRRAATAGAIGSTERVAPPDEALASDESARLRQALIDLPIEQRHAVVLAYYDGLSYRQVASRLGIPEGTAKSRLRLALARLRAALMDGGLRA